MATLLDRFYNLTYSNTKAYEDLVTQRSESLADEDFVILDRVDISSPMADFDFKARTDILIARIQEFKNSGSEPEGIFRLAGLGERVEQITSTKDLDSFSELVQMSSIHDAATALNRILDKKGIFSGSKLESIYNTLCKVEGRIRSEGITDPNLLKERMIQELDINSLLFEGLDEIKGAVLSKLVNLFKEIVDNQQHTKMSSDNLAITVATHLFIPVDQTRNIQASVAFRTMKPDSSTTSADRQIYNDASQTNPEELQNMAEPVQRKGLFNKVLMGLILA